MIKIDHTFQNTQIEFAASLLMKYVKEDNFWTFFLEEVAGTDLSEHDILENDGDIYRHLRLMFDLDLNIEIVPFNPGRFSSVIGDSAGNRIRENVRKLNSFTMPVRVGHLGHEMCHLFGYHHQYQGQKTSVAVVFGKVMEKYATRRLTDVTVSEHTLQ